MALLAWRFGIAAVLLWLLTVLRGRRRPGPLVADRRLALRLVAIGAFLLTAEVVAYFLGLQFVSAGLAETLLYLYPAIVVIIAAVFLHQRPTPVMVACVVTAFAGTALTIGAAGRGSPLGVALVLLAAVGFAAYFVVSGRLMPRIGAMVGTSLVMTGAAASFVVLAVVTGSQGPRTPLGWWAMLGMAVIGTVLSFGMLSAGLSRVPAPQAAVVATVEPVVTVVLGALLLGEQVVPLQVVGMAVILASVAVLLRAEARASLTAPPP